MLVLVIAISYLKGSNDILESARYETRLLNISNDGSRFSVNPLDVSVPLAGDWLLLTVRSIIS